jgi:uncharacterized protein YdcH (DUF465 family)
MDLLTASQYVPAGSVNEILVLAGVIALISTFLGKAIDAIMARSKKAVHSVVKRVMSDEEFKPIIAAVNTLPTINATLNDIMQKFESLDRRVKTLEGVSLETLKNEITEIYYDLIKEEKMQEGKYQRFMSLIAAYEKNGGNGVVPEFKRTLQRKHDLAIV